MAAEDATRPFRDAEAWLAARGVRREPIRVAASQAQPPGPPAASDAPPTARSAQAAPAAPPAPGAPAGTDGPGDQSGGDRSGGDLAGGDVPEIGEVVAKAVAYARRATAGAPMSEGRLRRRLAERGHPGVVVEQAIRRCRSERLVDDVALAAALVDEGRRKGHAPLRIRTDLSRRELPDDLIDEALAVIGDRDEEAAAFAVAKSRAAQLRGVDAETAFRRLVGFLARRGYTDALSRKVARAAVFDDRERERTAGH